MRVSKVSDQVKKEKVQQRPTVTAFVNCLLKHAKFSLNWNITGSKTNWIPTKIEPIHCIGPPWMSVVRWKDRNMKCCEHCNTQVPTRYLEHGINVKHDKTTKGGQNWQHLWVGLPRTSLSRKNQKNRFPGFLPLHKSNYIFFKVNSPSHLFQYVSRFKNKRNLTLKSHFSAIKWKQLSFSDSVFSPPHQLSSFRSQILGGQKWNGKIGVTWVNASEKSGKKL